MVFLFSDTQIKNETFVEDINNMLNSGEVSAVSQWSNHHILKTLLTNSGVLSCAW